MLVCAVVMLSLIGHAWWLYLALTGMAMGNLWIWSRPEPAKKSRLTSKAYAAARPLRIRLNRADTTSV